MKTGKFCKDDYDLLVKTGIIVPLEEGYKEKIEEIEKKKRMSIDEETQQELKIQKERLKSFYELVQDYPSHLVDTFKSMLVDYSKMKDPRQQIEKIDELIDTTKKLMNDIDEQGRKPETIEAMPIMGIVDTKGTLSHEDKNLKEREGEKLYTPQYDKVTKQYEERVRYRKASKSLGKETSYQVFSQYLQWIGRTLGDIYNLYHLPTRLQGYILKSIYKHLRHGEDDIEKIKMREEEEKEMFNFEEFKELNSSNIQLKDLINNWIAEKDHHKKNIIEKYIKNYVDNYFPNQTEIDLLVKHHIVVPEKITVKKDDVLRPTLANARVVLQEEKEQAEEKPHKEQKSPEEKIGIEDLKKPFLFYDKKDLSHDPLIRLAKENPAYSNVIVNQFIQGLISGETDLKEFDKIKNYLRLNEPSQPVKVIHKNQILKPHRYKKNPDMIHLK